jgi:SAM-dependent methyltransferase
VSDPSAATDVKRRLRSAYDAVSESVADRGDRGWRWLHAGVAAPGPGDDVVDTPLRWGPINADHARLTAELIGPTELDGADLLEAGCGRGGNLMACRRWFALRRSVGLDLSGAALRSVASGLGEREVRAVHGDAEQLPFAPGSFDAVLCIESAAHYPDRLAFFAEVARVLRPDGWFLYAESLDEASRAAVGRALTAAGLDLTFHADVGPRVRRHWAAVSATLSDREAVQAMTADERATVGPGADSALGRLLSDGENGYHLMRWRRADRPAAPGTVRPEDLALVNPGGDHAAGIIEAYGQGSWVRAVRGRRDER